MFRASWSMVRIVLAFLVCGSTLGFAQNTSDVYIAAEQAAVFSGPSKDSYPTSRLSSGDALEVHHESEDGWLAVRPPAGSFSWIPARQAYLLPGGRVIEITDQKAVSWIGTELGSAKQYLWQVELSVGEQLAVLGESTMKASDGGETLWYKVSPPAGEFRWIHKSMVSREPRRITSTNAKPLRSATPTRAVANENPQVDERSETSQGESGKVQTAAYDDDVFGESVLEGDVPSLRSSVVTNPMPDDVFVEGVPVDGSPVNAAPATVQAATDPWAGWHAFDFGVDGMRISLFDKLFRGGSRPQHDPLNHDPFDLSMAKSPSQPPQRTMPVINRTIEPTGAPPLRRNRPWRDPRTLGSGKNYYSSRGPARSGERFAGAGDSSRGTIESDGNEPRFADMPRELIASIRENVRALSNSRSAPSYSMEGQSGSRVAEPGPNRASGPNWYGVPTEAPPAESFASAQRDRSVDLQGPSVSQELDRLQIELSEMVALPPSTWNLDPIVQRAKHFIEYGANPIERGQARLLLERIEEFDQHARRSAFVSSGAVISANYRATPNPSGVSTASYAQPVPGANFHAGAAPIRNEATPSNYNASMTGDELAGKQPFDATGWLIPVHATSRGQPTHALADASGKIIAYVSALPGMRIDHHLNQAVGITGLRGYLPQLQASHIQAERVVALR